MRKNIIILIIMILGLILIGFVANNAPLFSVTDKSVIKIGAILTLSGEGASWGETSKNAIDLAITKINKTEGIHGKKIKIIYEDSSGDPIKTINAYKKLKDIDNVVAIIGPNMAYEVSAIAPLAANDNFPIITPSYANESTRINKKNPLLIWLDPYLESKELAKYIYDNGIKYIAVISTNDQWETEISNSFIYWFKESGGKIITHQKVNYDDKEIKTTITQLIKDNPEAVFVGTYYQFTNITKILKELNYKGVIYSAEVDDYLADQTKNYVNYLEFISSDKYSDDFVFEYEQTYRKQISIPAGQTYDTTNILLEIIKSCNSKVNCIYDNLENFKAYSGVSGKISIDDENRTYIPTAIYSLQRGKIMKIH